MTERLTPPAAVERLRSLAQQRPRALVGLCGPPGAGKSTLAAHLVSELGTDVAALLPMDGFHLANAALRRLDRAGRKGAIDTFDAEGYAAMVVRLASGAEPVVYAPEFDRRLEEAIAAAIRIPRDVPIVIVEGNYLLADGPGWTEARTHFVEIWYVELDPVLRHKRLVDRHIRYGRSPAEAEDWVTVVDEVNAELIATTAHRADAIISPGTS